ncbi:MAG: hypothetical protein Q7Q71_08365 [Verrucomicrobiota bacterium JB023]|nr:hypothetical protein [Verrucomicrobiota bacterium JB023]
MDFPLQLRFKVLTLFSQKATVTDANGQFVCFLKQRSFRFREKVEVFADPERSQLLATISADRILDWSARYTFHDANGQEIGSVGRKGGRSLWRAHYEVFNPGDNTPDFTIREENPWKKFLDGFLGEIPVVGFFTGFFLHPSYVATRGTQESMRLTKEPAFLEGKFRFDKLGDPSPREELNLLLSFLMLNILEKRRG